MAEQPILFTTAGKVGYWKAPQGQEFGDLESILEAIRETSQGTEVDIARNRFYKAVLANRPVQSIIGHIIMQAGGSLACSFGEQALVMKLKHHQHLLRITIKSEVELSLFEKPHTGIVDTFSVMIPENQNPHHSIILSVTPHLNVMDVSNEHVLALSRLYPPQTGALVFTDAKSENVGLLPDGTPLGVDLGAFRKVPETSWGEMLITQVEANINGMREVGNIVVPSYEWHMPDGTLKQHALIGNPRDSQLAGKLRKAMEVIDNSANLQELHAYALGEKQQTKR